MFHIAKKLLACLKNWTPLSLVKGRWQVISCSYRCWCNCSWSDWSWRIYRRGGAGKNLCVRYFFQLACHQYQFKLLLTEYWWITAYMVADLVIPPSPNPKTHLLPLHPTNHQPLCNLKPLDNRRRITLMKSLSKGFKIIITCEAVRAL